MNMIIGSIISLTALIASYIWAFKAGKEKERASNKDKINKAAIRAIYHRHHLRRDSNYARRVRKKFTR